MSPMFGSIVDHVASLEKHAIVDRSAGTIALRLDELQGAELEVTFQNDERGLPNDFPANQTTGSPPKSSKVW